MRRRGGERDLERAERILYEALPLVRDWLPRQEINLYEALISLYETGQEWEKAKQASERALEVVESQLGRGMDPEYQMRHRAEYAYILAKLGEAERAEALLKDYDGMSRGDESLFTTRAFFELARALLLETRGQFEAARESFRKSVELLKKGRSTGWSQPLTEYALFEMRRGDTTKALSLLQEALAGSDQFGRHADSRYIRQMIEELTQPASGA